MRRGSSVDQEGRADDSKAGVDSLQQSTYDTECIEIVICSLRRSSIALLYRTAARFVNGHTTAIQPERLDTILILFFGLILITSVNHNLDTLSTGFSDKMGLQSNPVVQRIYRSLPVPLQNAAVSVLGYRIKRKRYNREFKRYSRRYHQHQWRDKSEWNREQVDKLRSVLETAVHTTDHYRDLETIDLEQETLVTEQIKSLPLLSADVLKNDPQSLISNQVDVDNCISLSTSGTTGTPKTTYHSPSSQRKYWAAMDRFWRQGGCRYGDRRASFTGNKIVPTEKDNGPFGRIDYANNRLLLSTYHLGTDTVDEYLELLKDFNPDFIDGYPSSIRYCSQRAMETNFDLRIPACFPTAETLSQQDREIIEEGLSTKVFNQYGSTESACLITECRCGNLHVNPEIGIVEIIDSHGEPVSAGEVGELVLTGLNNHTMPLIRYRIGDLARGPPKYIECACGWNTPVIEEVIGRQDEVVITADGRRIPMLSYNVFKYTKNIKESQIVQESVDEFILKIVPDEDYTEDQATIAVEKLKSRVGKDISVEVDLLEALPRTDSGKYRAVISNVDSKN